MTYTTTLPSFLFLAPSLINLVEQSAESSTVNTAILGQPVEQQSKIIGGRWLLCCQTAKHTQNYLYQFIFIIL